MFLQDQEGEAGGQEVFPTKRGNGDMLFAGGDQGPRASCPCWSQSVLVGMASQDAVGARSQRHRHGKLTCGWMLAGGEQGWVWRENTGRQGQGCREVGGNDWGCTRLQAEEKALGEEVCSGMEVPRFPGPSAGQSFGKGRGWG